MLQVQMSGGDVDKPAADARAALVIGNFMYGWC